MGAPTRRAVWREPMLWLVAGLPLLVLLAAAGTLALAGSAPADVGAARVRRIAQVQVEDLAPDRAAARHGLRAELRVEPAQGWIEVSLHPAALEESPLELRLLHPLDERGDQTVTLQRDGRVWRGRVARWNAHDRELRLSGARGEWRLSGRLPRAATFAQLSPGVAP